MAASDVGSSGNLKWRVIAPLGVAGLLVVGVLLGFIVLPLVQGRAAGIDPYTAICRALGVLPGSPARPTPPSAAVARPVTLVAWDAKTFDQIYHADRAAGERIATQRCVACHPLTGNTPDVAIPRNNGQSRFALYKQLHDFRSGARVNPTMSPQVAGLDDKAIADLAAYYGALVRGVIDAQRGPPFVGANIEDIVSNGDVSRGLPPCAACHGSRTGGPIETPTLTGQYATYLEAQLRAFATGQRHNDIYHRMRSVAAKLSPDEMNLIAIYYSGQ